MPQRLHALVVPGIVAVMTLAYWVQIADASRTAVLVPIGIIALIAAFLAVVVVRDMRNAPEAPASSSLIHLLAKPVGLIALSVGYWGAFQYLGFNVANALFLGLVFLLAGGHWSRAILLSGIGTVVLHVLARAMDFDLPDPFWTVI